MVQRCFPLVRWTLAGGDSRSLSSLPLRAPVYQQLVSSQPECFLIMSVFVTQDLIHDVLEVLCKRGYNSEGASMRVLWWESLLCGLEMTRIQPGPIEA